MLPSRTLALGLIVSFSAVAAAVCRADIGASHLTPNLVATIDRPLRYHPDHGDFVIENGREYFNRSLYGGNTAFRVDGGDKPEFVLYLPGRGGNLRLGIRTPHGAKWLDDAAQIETRYRPGELIYEIRDPLLGAGVIRIASLAYAETEGLVVRVEARQIAPGVDLVWGYGGVNGQRGKRDGDIGTEKVPISQWFQLQPAFCRGNRFAMTGTGFTLQARPATIVGVMPEGAHLAVADAARWSDLPALLRSAGRRSPGFAVPAAHSGRDGTAASPLAGARAPSGGTGRPPLAPETPVIVGRVPLAAGTPLYLSLQRVAPAGGARPAGDLDIYREVTAPPAGSRRHRHGKSDAAAARLEPAFTRAELPARFAAAGRHFAAIRDRVKVDTPDPFLNAAVGALNVAADAVWDGPQQAIMHGAIAWRTRLLGWRGPYLLDALGWHERFRRNALYWIGRQNTGPIPTHVPPADAKANLARNEAGLHTNGDMSNSHYDMNLVFVDALFRHLQWTGDLAFARRVWPAIVRHLAWERRLFRREYGPQKLPLYEAYAAIWASDDLQYSGGGAMHATAYNYYENRQAARLARLIGGDPTPYDREANLLARSMRELLWVTPSEAAREEGGSLFGPGWGPEAALAVANERRPQVRGLPDSGHPGAARAGRPPAGSGNGRDDSVGRPLAGSGNGMNDDVGRPLASAGPDAGPGWFAEYKDWLGLRRVHPDAALWTFYTTVDSEVPTPEEAWWMTRQVDAEIPHLPVRGPGVPPGLWTLATSDWMPYDWSINNVVMAEAVHAGLALWEAGRPGEAWAVTKGSILAAMYLGISPGNVGSMSYLDVYRRESQRDFADGGGVLSRALVEGLFGVKPDALAGEIRVAPGWPASWRHASIRHPDFSFAFRREGAVDSYVFTQRITPRPAQGHGPAAVERPGFPRPLRLRFVLVARSDRVAGVTVDGRPAPWSVVQDSVGRPRIAIAVPAPAEAPGQAQVRATLSVRWAGAPIATRPERSPAGTGDASSGFAPVRQGEMAWLRPTGLAVPTRPAAVWGQDGMAAAMTPAARARDTVLGLLPVPVAGAHLDPIDLAAAFNDRVTQIFRNQYLSPRSPFVSLSLPKQGIGGWAGGVNRTADIDDAGLRAVAAQNGGRLVLPNGVPLVTPDAARARNIVFTSQWDNYPRQATVPLAGHARGIYLLLAGSTDPMQSRFENGVLDIAYTDGTKTRLPLVNPTNWWPIEQDYFIDDYQFRRPEPLPIRIDLKTGRVRVLDLRTFQGRGGEVPGGAATVLSVPLDPAKTLRSLTLRTTANDVVIGLMAATLVRP